MKTVQSVFFSQIRYELIFFPTNIYRIRLFAIRRSHSTTRRSSKVPRNLWKLTSLSRKRRNFPTSAYSNIQFPVVRSYAIQREKRRFIVARRSRSRESRARNNNWVGLVVFGYLLWGSRYFSTAGGCSTIVCPRGGFHRDSWMERRGEERARKRRKLRAGVRR